MRGSHMITGHGKYALGCIAMRLGIPVTSGQQRHSVPAWARQAARWVGWRPLGIAVTAVVLWWVIVMFGKMLWSVM